MFCIPELVLGGTKGARSRFHVLRSRMHLGRDRGSRIPFSFLRSRTHFRLYRGYRVPFSCFALSDSFWAVFTASCSIFMFCAPGLVLGDTVGVGSSFYVLRSRTYFFEGAGSHFHILCSMTRFVRYRGRQVKFSYFAFPDSFSTIPRASGEVFMFCALRLILGGTKGVGSRFHVFTTDSFSAVPRASGSVFMFCALGLVFCATEGVGSSFHVLCSRTRFRRY
jgi:hypothetical protein